MKAFWLLASCLLMISTSSGSTPSPTASPTMSPTAPTTPFPTHAPTNSPTDSPTISPSHSPTHAPTAPTQSPTDAPTISPTHSPTDAPTTSTNSPTHTPTASTHTPTAAPTHTPTSAPTHSPTQSPIATTHSPTASPVTAPTTSPTIAPTSSPSMPPTASPTATPSQSPTHSPTMTATNSPTAAPTSSPTPMPAPKSWEGSVWMVAIEVVVKTSTKSAAGSPATGAALRNAVFSILNSTDQPAAANAQISAHSLVGPTGPVMMSSGGIISSAPMPGSSSGVWEVIVRGLSWQSTLSLRSSLPISSSSSSSLALQLASSLSLSSPPNVTRVQNIYVGGMKNCVVIDNTDIELGWTVNGSSIDFQLEADGVKGWVGMGISRLGAADAMTSDALGTDMTIGWMNNETQCKNGCVVDAWATNFPPTIDTHQDIMVKSVSQIRVSGGQKLVVSWSRLLNTGDTQQDRVIDVNTLQQVIVAAEYDDPVVGGPMGVNHLFQGKAWDENGTTPVDFSQYSACGDMTARIVVKSSSPIQTVVSWIACCVGIAEDRIVGDATNTQLGVVSMIILPRPHTSVQNSSLTCQNSGPSVEDAVDLLVGQLTDPSSPLFTNSAISLDATWIPSTTDVTWCNNGGGMLAYDANQDDCPVVTTTDPPNKAKFPFWAAIIIVVGVVLAVFVVGALVWNYSRRPAVERVKPTFEGIQMHDAQDLGDAREDY